MTFNNSLRPFNFNSVAFLLNGRFNHGIPKNMHYAHIPLEWVDFEL